MRKDFDDCIELIESEKIKNFVKKALGKASEQFWKEPSSSSGKRHPPEDNVEGGIIVHSRKAIRVALALFKFFDIKGKLTQDKIIAALILHDIQKRGIPWGENTNLEHGMIAYCWLLKIAAVELNPEKEDIIHIDSDLFEICFLVKNHMAVWSQPLLTPAFEKGEVMTDYSIWNLIVQLSDYLASQKWCPFVCDDFGEN